MIITEEETFGPVAPIMRFKTEEEALSIANDSEYGLASYVFTKVGCTTRTSLDVIKV